MENNKAVGIKIKDGFEVRSLQKALGEGWSSYPLKSSFETIYPEEMQKKILDNWTKYGLK